SLLAPVEMHSDDDGRLLLLSAPVSGRTAATYLRNVGPLTSEEGLLWGLSLCEALADVHQRGGVHGCLSPANVYLDGPSTATEVRLLDTSLLLFRSIRSLPVPPDVVLVPAAYLAPERVSGNRATALSDVYGLGVLMYELLTGRSPFLGHDVVETKRRHLVANMPALPASLALWHPLLERCLAKEPQARFSSVMEVRQALLGLSAVVEEDELEEAVLEEEVPEPIEIIDDGGEFVVEGELIS
ncbi:MAG: protein kinase, partial [Archangium sp.]|nr:protein kinase [Archangium sp.]